MEGLRKKPIIKVAVVGSGLAGLTAANLLATTPSDKVHFEVHVFEKSEKLGMDAHSISIPIEEKAGSGGWRVDVPMRSFQGGYYPQLIALYKSLGVRFRQADFSYSFSNLYATHGKPTITTSMIYNGASGRAGVSIPSALNNRSSGGLEDPFIVRWFARIMAKLAFFGSAVALLFNYARLAILSAPVFRHSPDLTFFDWVEQTVPTGFLARVLGLDSSWRDFCAFVLVPLFSAVCTAPREDVMQHPAEEFLGYVWLTLFTHHYVAVNGVRDVVNRLATPIPHIHTRASITSMHADQHDPSKVTINTNDSAHPGFSHVIFATQANSAVPIVSSYMSSLPAESTHKKNVRAIIQCLRTFHYCRNVVVNHTDDSLMPDSLPDWRDLNLVNAVSDDEEKQVCDVCVHSSYTMATHVLERPPSATKTLPRVYQTTNPIIAPAAASVLSIARLERAVLTVTAKSALPGLVREERQWWQGQGRGPTTVGPLQGAGRLSSNAMPGIWICGSYAYYGIPLLEGCVVSAKNVVDTGILPSEGVVPVIRPW